MTLNSEDGSKVVSSDALAAAGPRRHCVHSPREMTNGLNHWRLDEFHSRAATAQAILPPPGRSHNIGADEANCSISIIPGVKYIIHSTLIADSHIHHYCESITRVALLLCTFELIWLFIYLLAPYTLPSAVQFWANCSSLVFSSAALLHFAYGGIVYINADFVPNFSYFNCYRLFSCFGIFVSLSFVLIGAHSNNIFLAAGNLSFLVFYILAESRARILILLISLTS